MTQVGDPPANLPDDEARKLRLIKAALERAAVPKSSADIDTNRRNDLATGVGRLEVRCPSCHTPVDVAVDTSLTDLTCGSCGSHFSLVDQSQATRMAPALAEMGRFELIERVGFGAFGSVWKARDKQLDRTVAVKIPRHGDMSAEEQEKFLREARAAAQLRHPGIVSVHEVGRHEQTVFIVSDFIRGLTLGDWHQRQPLINREAAALLAQIADALDHAHEHGVVHRDLKPANIMIDGDGAPHVMDFGLARRDVGEVTLTVDGFALGTPAYMSPEQAAGAGHKADRRSDVYSLGVILFQLLTGELPFRGNAHMLIHQVIHDDPPSPRKFNAQVAHDLETIALKCLEKDPDRRYQSARELADELRRFLAGEPITARPIHRIARGWRWCKRKPLVASLSAAVLLLLVASTLVSATAAYRLATARAHDESARRAQLAVVSDRLEAALQAQDWKVFDPARIEIEAKFSDLAGVRELLARVDEERKVLTSQQEATARAELQRIERTVADGDLLLAHFQLAALPPSIPGSRAWQDSAESVGKMREQIDRFLAEYPLEDCGSYWLHKAAVPESRWKSIQSLANDLLTTGAEMSPRIIGIARVMCEHETDDHVLSAQGHDEICFMFENLECGWQRSANSGDFLLVGCDGVYDGSRAPAFEITSLRHQSARIPVQVNFNAVETLGTVILKRIPSEMRGKLAIDLLPEKGMAQDEIDMCVIRDEIGPGTELKIPLRNTKFEISLAAGSYELRPSTATTNGIPRNCVVNIQRGQTSRLNLPVYAPRQIELEWRYRKLGAGDRWKIHRSRMLSDGSPHSDQWPIGDLISDSIGFANWDGQGTELTFSGCKAARLPLAQLPEEMQEVDELVRVNRAPDPFPISVGDIFGATVEKAFGASTIEWELLFQVKSITPVLGAATTE